MAKFSLNLFGGAVIEGPEGPCHGPVSQQRRLALLAVLALARGRPVSRDLLLALLWPESGIESARHNLADSVYRIRKQLGKAAILSVGENLVLNVEVVSSDVGAFEEALDQGRQDEAIAIYAGPLMNGFHLSDSHEFEEWLDVERDRLERAYAAALEQLAEKAAERGDTVGAVEWWLRRTALDQYNARITVRLMEAMDAAGDRVGAIRQARIHAELLDQELDAEPDRDVAALAEQLRSAPLPDPPRSPDGNDLDREPTVLAVATGGKNIEGSPAPTALGPSSEGRSRFRAKDWIHAGRMTVLVLGFAAAFSAAWLLFETRTRTISSEGSTAAAGNKIAVLPFSNLNRDPEEEYFSNGLTEELIGVLSRVRALQVVARTSTFAFKGEVRDIREIGRALNVDKILEGSVRREGDRVRVTAQLIDTASGFHLWSETYEREGTDIIDIQTNLVLRIVAALETELTPAEYARLERRTSASPAAHAHYLKGRYFWNQRSSIGFARASEHYRRAIDADPRHADAYAGLAMTYSLQGLTGELPIPEARQRMHEAALKAVALDEELAGAHTALGAYLNVYAWNSEASERAFLRAIELDPGDGTTRHLYGNLLWTVGRLDEAIEQKRRAVELDPLAPQLSNSLGRILLVAGHVRESVEHFNDVLELDSTFWRAHASLGDYYTTIGRLDEAVGHHRRAARLAGGTQGAVAGLAHVLALAGREHEARELLLEVQAQAARTGSHNPNIASVLVALHDLEDALEWLELAYQQRHPGLRLIVPGAAYTRFPEEPGFLDLWHRIDLHR